MHLILSRVFVYTGLFFLLTTSAFAEKETLEHTLAVTYQNNPSLAAARARLRATDEQVARALSGYRPDISATIETGASRQRRGSHASISEKDTTPRNASINVTQSVFSGFRTWAEVQSAEASVKAERAALQDTEQRLLLETAKTYLAVAQAEEVLAISKNIEYALQKRLDEVQDRLRIGELKKTDVAQATSRLKAATVSRLQAQGDLANQRTAYARLVGQVPAGALESPQLALNLPKTEDEAVTRALKNNPAVLAANHNKDAARADITATGGALLPSVDLIGSASHSYDQSGLSPVRQDTTSILARLTVPLYRTGVDYARTRAAEQGALQRRFELDDARDKVREEALRAWQSLATARDTLVGRREVAAAAAEALAGVKTEARFGTRTTIDVLNAEQELYDASINLARAGYEEIFATLQLKSAVGELTADSLRLPVTLYDPVKNYKTIRRTWVGFSKIRD